MSRSRLHAPRCCFDTHPQLQRRSFHFLLMPCYVARPTSVPQLYHKSRHRVNYFLQNRLGKRQKNIASPAPLCHPRQQVLTACGQATASTNAPHRVRKCFQKCHWLTVVIFLSVGDGVYNVRIWGLWATPAPNI
jgi:hypothetical protein